MTLNEFLRNEYKQRSFRYSKTVVTALKMYNYRITVKQIRRELNKIIRTS